MKTEQEKGRRTIPLGVRVTPEAAELLGKLAEVISRSLSGVRVSKSQALEVAIREALAARPLAARGVDIDPRPLAARGGNVDHA